MKISIIIPNYNGQNLLQKNIPQLLKILSSYNLHVFELFIIDDASLDNSIEIIENITKSMPGNVTVQLLRNDKNYGFSTTCNKGIKLATGLITFLFNTDIVPEAGFLEPLLKHFTDQKIFAVGLLDKSIENGKTILRGRGKGKWDRGFVLHSREEVNGKSTFWVSGGSSVFSTKVLQKLGGFDEIYNPFYWEDIDLSYRAQKAGYDVFFEKDSVVTHWHEEGAIRKNIKPDRIQTIAYRNQIIFVWKNISDSRLLISHFLWLPIHVLIAIVRLNKPFLKGFLLAVQLSPAIIVRRGQEKKFWKKSDREILNASL